MDLPSTIHVLSSEGIPDDLLLNQLCQINENIILLDRTNENVVHLILRINWTERSDEICKAYCEVVLNLVTAHSIYLRSVLRMIIRHFSADLTSDNTIPEINQHVHLLLWNICKLVPLAPPLLLPMLADGFPYMRKLVAVQVYYLRNVLHMTEYLPNIRPSILELVVIKLLQIDVHCPRSVILESEDPDESTDTLFQMEEDGVSKPNEEVDHHRHPLANVLDVLIQETFQYIHKSCESTSKAGFSKEQQNWEATKKVYKELLGIFDSVILPTHDCAHVQFIMFYICSFKNLLCEGFIDYLWKKVQNPNISSVIRQASACYMGSLLARARYVPIRMVQDCLTLMCNWVNCYIDNQCGSSYTYADTVHHATFYAVSQVVFYLVTFRHQEMVCSKRGRLILQELNLERIVNCRLNPLRVCLPVVVRNFATIARNYQIAYCHTIIERNMRLFLPRISDNSCTEESGFSTLETFFPFDPYLLKRSGKVIHPLYREYEGHHEETPLEREDQVGSPEIVATGSNQEHSFLSDLFHYGTSPGYRQPGHIKSKYRLSE